MSKMDISIIERCPTNGNQNFTYTFKTTIHFLDPISSEPCTSEYADYQNLNYIARRLLTTVTKLKNNLEKKYNALVIKEERYKDNEKSYAYFKTLEDAQNGKDYIDSIILSVEMAGFDNIYQERKEKNKRKKANKQEKEIQEILSKSLQFKNQKGKMYVSYHHMHDRLTYDEKIINVTRCSEMIIFQLQSGCFKILYSDIEIPKVGTIHLNNHFTFITN